MTEQQQQQQEHATAALRTIAADLNSLGATLYHRRKDDEALEMYQEAFEILLIATSPAADREGHPPECYDDRQVAMLRRGAAAFARGREHLAVQDNISQAGSSSFHQEEEQEDSEFEHQPKRTRPLMHPLSLTASPYDSATLNDRYNLSGVVYNMALVYIRKQSYDTARQMLDIVLETVPSLEDDCCMGGGGQDDHVGPDKAVVVRYCALNNLGHLDLAHLGRHEEGICRLGDAFALCQRATSAARRSSGSTKGGRAMLRDHLALILTNHAVALCDVGEACESRQMHGEALTVYGKIVGTRRTVLRQGLVRRELDNPRSSMIYSRVFYRMGHVHYVRGDKLMTIQAFDFALALRRAALGSDRDDECDDIEVASLLHDVGLVQLEVGLLDHAMQSFVQCLRLRRTLLGRNHREVAEILYRMGRIHQDRHQYDEAMRAYREAMRVERIALGRDHPDVAITLTNIGQIHYLRGRLDRALEVYREVLAVVRKSMGEFHPSIAEIQNTIGTIHLDRGDSQEAISAFTEARRIEELAAAAGYSIEGMTGCSDDVGINEMACAPAA